MATPFTPTHQPSLETSKGDWQEARHGAQESSNFRSVTPAMNNTRGSVRNPSPTAGRPQSSVEAHYGARSNTPSGRYVDSFNPPEGGPQQQPSQPTQNSASTPTSAGLIRLTLRKPMGIVFEPMYDPNNPSLQRGVRICDLPRTGAAALSRRLEIGDELLSINDKTMSRLSFDEIMDFIIEADPEQVNLLFRRPRKETLNARHGIKAPNPTGPGVKWIDDEDRKRKEEKKKKEPSNSKKDKKSARRSKHRDDDETMQSEDDTRARDRDRRKKGRRKDPYESESFLDILIDTICANPDSVCRDRRRGGDDDDYYSDDDGTFASRDDSTYVTYESEEQRKDKKKKDKSKSLSKGQNRDDDSSTYQETEEDTLEDKAKKARDKDGKRSSPPKESKRNPAAEAPKKYEDDGTLETVDSAERAKSAVLQQEQAPPPLGLAPNPQPAIVVGNVDTDDDVNPAPIKEVEYEDGDHGADVSVMESLGGPSLLIEKQRQAAATARAPPTQPVPQEIMLNFGKDYPLDFGFSREQTIQNDPLRFYTFVVKGLLQEHEPEKVRLLDKLLAKYKGREDHLVQKLSVRYNKEEEEQEQEDNFEEAVNKGKDSAHASAAIQTARERLQNDFNPAEWPEKETKEQEEEDTAPQTPQQAEQGSDSNSDYSGSDSIDGTSPAVIAQVSELLNYVYGKTSVPGQIDRVSTIMRAYEGREAVLLELLETKALIKANREKENAGNLPSFLRNSANAQRAAENDAPGEGDVPPVTPMATQPPAAINDDISSMSGVSTPAVDSQQASVLKQISVCEHKKS